MPVHIEREATGLVTAWLDHAPKRNAMDDTMLGALAELLEQLTGECEARALVIRGRNGCFCSGRDLGELSAGANGAEASVASRLEPINRLARAFRHCAVPVIALVQGKAAGLGVSLACWSDITIVTADATFSIPEARAGIAPSVTAVSLMEAVGRRRAVELCLTGRGIDSATALAIGLAQYGCALEDAEQTLQSVAALLGQGAPQALRLTKELVQRADAMDFHASLAAANQTAERSLAGPDLVEGLRARRERRPPAWQQARDLTLQPTAALP